MRSSGWSSDVCSSDLQVGDRRRGARAMRRTKTRRTGTLPLVIAGPLLALGLAGCDPASQAMMAGASVVSFVHTDKTLREHFATWASMGRASRRGSGWQYG